MPELKLISGAATIYACKTDPPSIQSSFPDTKHSLQMCDMTDVCGHLVGAVFGVGSCLPLSCAGLTVRQAWFIQCGEYSSAVNAPPLPPPHYLQHHGISQHLLQHHARVGHHAIQSSGW